MDAKFCLAWAAPLILTWYHVLCMYAYTVQYLMTNEMHSAWVPALASAPVYEASA